MPPARNAPCPCGSGRKYKRCHGATQAEISAVSITTDPLVVRANAVKRTDDELHSLLTRFARKRGGADWFPRAIDTFMVGCAAELTHLEMELAIPWVLYNCPTVDIGEPMAVVMGDEQRRRLSLPMVQLLVEQLSTYLSVWQVTSVRPGVGLLLEDLLTGNTQFVHDVKLSQSAPVHVVLLGRIVVCDDVAFVSGMHNLPLAPLAADRVVQAMRRLCRVRTRPIKPDRLRDPVMQLDLLNIWREVLEMESATPVITNTDGDPLSLTTDRYDFPARDRDRLIAALQQVDGASAAESVGDVTEIVLLKSGARGRPLSDITVIARLEVQATRLIAETNSVRRADDTRAQIEAAAGTLLRHRIRSETSAASLLKQAELQGAGRDRRPQTEMTPEMQVGMREFLERYMQQWLDESIPALHGLTPRQAAADPKQHRALEALIRELEYREGEKPEADRYDTDTLRNTLGMPRSR